MKKIILALVISVPALAVPLWMATREESAGRTESRTTSDDSSHPIIQERAIQGIGFVEPVTEVRKLVFKVEGVIARCPAEIGRTYKKGDVLMELDNREQLAAIAVADAEWKMADAERHKNLSGVNTHQIDAALRKVEIVKEQVRHSQREHSRFHAAMSLDAVAPLEYDRSLTEMKQKQTELQQAEADLRHLQQYVRDEDRTLADAKVCAANAKLDLAKQHFEDTRLLAPFDGTVLELLKREGEGSRLFDPEPVALFGDPSRLRVRAEVDERFVSGLKIGQKATVFGRGLGQKQYSGRVVLIKSIMGKKTVFSRSATERKDLDVLQVFIEMETRFQAPIGLEVDVELILTTG